MALRAQKVSGAFEKWAPRKLSKSWNCTDGDIFQDWKVLEKDLFLESAENLFNSSKKYGLCGSRKYPHTPTDGQGKFLGGGGLKGRNFQGVWGLGT